MLPETQFPFLAEKGHVVSLVGGGGKTTLLYAFARHCAAKGWRVLVSTTTHIRQPGENYAADEAALAALWAAGQYAVAGVPAEQGKLTALPPEQLTRWMAQADMVLLEADGAKRMPCKVPAAHEPVLLPESDIVLAVAGLSALGRPLREVCFRLEQACALLGAAPETTLFVGDSNVDIATAKAAGLASCGVLWGFRTLGELQQAGADHIAETPAALQALILGQ